MNGFYTDETQWFRYWMDMPLGPPGGATRESAARAVGNAVKSLERESPHGFPVHHGKLAVYDEAANRAVVIGHGSPISPRGLIWEGTLDAYARTWEVD